MTKREQVQNLYDKFKAYTETAEQHEFPYLIQYDMLISAGYKNLQEAWDENHADIFIKSVSKSLKQLGINIEE